MKYRAIYSHGEVIYEVTDDTVTIDKRGQQSEEAGYYVMCDIAPYKSQLTGEMVQSRSQHRALLKAHNCIEVGNETKYLKPKQKEPPAGLKQRIIDIVNSKL